MKTIQLIFIIITLFLTSCSKDDGGDVNVPTISYSTTSLNATLYEPGYSPAPNINWNGEQGSFQLSDNIEGLSIDNSTGVIHWTKLLPPGSHDFGVIAKNSAGQAAVDFALFNPVQGIFSGDLALGDGYANFEFNILPEGLVEVFVRRFWGDGSEYEPLRGEGTWVQNNTLVEIDFTLSDIVVNYMFSGSMEITNTNAILTGELFAYTSEERGVGIEMILLKN